MMAIKIYTKTGDKGKTSLLSGEKVWKDDVRLEAVGTIDELVSVLGIISSKMVQKNKILIQNYQSELIKISSFLVNRKENPNQKLLISAINNLEKEIDRKEKHLSELHQFILPIGEVGSLIHFARTICRRAERRVITLSKKEKVDPLILAYLNRFSDLMFVLARWVNFELKEKETVLEKNV